MRLPPKMTPAQIAEAQRWRASGGASARPDRAALSARWTNVRLQGKGLLPGLQSPLALPMKVGVALAEPVQSRSNLHHRLDAEADLFPFVRAKPLNQLVGALATVELESEVPQVMCDITSR
jgi:hypothetical protein